MIGHKQTLPRQTFIHHACITPRRPRQLTPPSTCSIEGAATAMWTRAAVKGVGIQRCVAFPSFFISITNRGHFRFDVTRMAVASSSHLLPTTLARFEDSNTSCLRPQAPVCIHDLPFAPTTSRSPPTLLPSFEGFKQQAGCAPTTNPVTSPPHFDRCAPTTNLPTPLFGQRGVTCPPPTLPPIPALVSSNKVVAHPRLLLFRMTISHCAQRHPSASRFK